MTPEIKNAIHTVTTQKAGRERMNALVLLANYTGEKTVYNILLALDAIEPKIN